VVCNNSPSAFIMTLQGTVRMCSVRDPPRTRWCGCRPAGHQDSEFGQKGKRRLCCVLHESAGSLT